MKKRLICISIYIYRFVPPRRVGNFFIWRGAPGVAVGADPIVNSVPLGADGVRGDDAVKGEEGADCPKPALPKPLEVEGGGKLRLLQPIGDAGWLDPNVNAVLDAGAANEKDAPNVPGLLGAELACGCPNGLLDPCAPNANVDPKEKGPFVGDCVAPPTSEALLFCPNGKDGACGKLITLS